MTEYGKNEEPISLMKKYEIYCNNRRNKMQALQRAALPAGGDFGTGVGSSWAPHVDTVDLTTLDGKAEAKVQARCAWLRSIDAKTVVVVKQEPGFKAASEASPPPPLPPQPPPPPAPPPAACGAQFTGSKRQRPLNLGLPRPKPAEQVHTTKAVNPAEKDALASERSRAARVAAGEAAAAEASTAKPAAAKAAAAKAAAAKPHTRGRIIDSSDDDAGPSLSPKPKPKGTRPPKDAVPSVKAAAAKATAAKPHTRGRIIDSSDDDAGPSLPSPSQKAPAPPRMLCQQPR